MVLQNSDSLLIGIELLLTVDIPPNSLLLFEIFGIKNPNASSIVNISIFIVRVKTIVEIIMTSASNFVHYLFDFTYDISASISITPEFSEHNIQGQYNSPLFFNIVLNDFVFPDFQISLKFSSNLNSSNAANADLKQYVRVDNLDTDVYYVDAASYSQVPVDEIIANNDNSDNNDNNADNSDNLDDSTQNTRLLQDSNDTSSNSNSSNGDNSDSSGDDSIDSNEDDGDDDDITQIQDQIDLLTSELGTTYNTPVINNFTASAQEIKLTLLQPSLSQRTVLIAIYLFLLPDTLNEIDVEFTIYVRNDTLFSQNASFAFSTANLGFLSSLFS
jgi:hypothetical protein